MKNLCITLTCFFYLYTVSGQQIDSALAKYASSYVPEKLYLHFDKSAYLPGETVWFKAYLMEDLLPAEKTKNVYVDWLDDDGTVLYHSISPVISGSTFGQFEIPSQTTTGILHVRAYTKWMLNFDTAFLFKRDIPLLTGNSKNSKSKPVSAPAISFFPEGGDLITGVYNRIAFKANDQWGWPVKVKGVVVDNKGKVVDSIKTQHDGMGTFQLRPEAGVKYVAKWKDERGADRTTAIPDAKASGIAMQMSIEGTKRIISFYSNSELPDNLKQLHLVGTVNSQMAFKNDIAMSPANTVKRVIPTSSLPSGILILTLFDVDWNAIAERITFVDNQDYSFQPSMEVLHWGLSKRKRNEIEIKLPDSLAEANFSISVTDASVDRDTTENIISHFLLTSDIKGYVHNPAYYFSGDDQERKMELDLVMLTNGWRRFKWEDLKRGQMPKITYNKDTGYLSLSGQLLGVTKGQLSGADNLLLIVKQKDSASKLMIVPVNRDGTFNDPNFVFFDTLTVYYSLKSKFMKQAEARFMTGLLPAPNYSTFARNFQNYKPFNDTSGLGYHFSLASQELSLKELQRNKTMETVYIKAKGKTPVQVLEDKYPSGLFKGGDGLQFDLVNDPLSSSYMDIFRYLQGKVAGLQISGDPEPTLSWRGGTPALYLDEMRADVGLVGNVPITDVAYIKVFRPPFMGSSGGGSGAIAIYTKKGDDTRSTSGGGLTTNKISGYTPIREFYSPNYDRFDTRSDEKDVRTTIYWNPRVNITPQKPAAKLVFYNNDITKSFRVIIEGVSSNGMFTHFEQIME